MLLLKWKEKSEWLKEKYRELRTQYFWDEEKFVAVLFFGESNPSQVYVKLKKKYSEEIWFDFLVFEYKLFLEFLHLYYKVKLICTFSFYMAFLGFDIKWVGYSFFFW